MCALADELDSWLASVPGGERCMAQRVSGGSCCGVRSIGTYAALVANRTSCADLTDGDADAFRQLLTTCAADFTAGLLGYQVWTDRCRPRSACWPLPLHYVATAHECFARSAGAACIVPNATTVRAV